MRTWNVNFASVGHWFGKIRLQNFGDPCSPAASDRRLRAGATRH